MFISALSGQQLQLAGFAFMDDTDLCMNDTSNDPKPVVKKMQKIPQPLGWPTKCHRGILSSQKMLLVCT